MVELEAGKKVIVQLKVTRGLGTLHIFLKSQEFEEWIKSIALYPNRESHPYSTEHWNITDKPGWDRHKAYRIKKEDDKDQDLACLYSWGANNLYILERKVPNLAFLKAKGLSEGVTFTLKGLYSSNEIERWKRQAKEQMIRLYRNYISPINDSVYILDVEDHEV